MSAKAPRLRLVEQVDLPLVEASAVAAVPSATGGVHVLLVGDRSSVLASARYDGEVSAWQQLDLTTVDGWPLQADDPSQLEGIAVDGAGTVALLREDPPTVLLLDLDGRRVTATVPLHHGREGWADYWADPASRGEGLLLLRGGRLLVAKEKHPAALVEFAPQGSTARGVSAEDLLGAGERWDAARTDAAYEAVAAWPLTGAAAQVLEDVSDLAVGPAGELWLLSDKSRSVARVDLPLGAAGGEVATVAECWRLPKGAEKPEGIASLGDGRVLVVLDLSGGAGAGWVVERVDEER
jgi:uncharacterized protein YjiK